MCAMVEDESRIYTHGSCTGFGITVYIQSEHELKRDDLQGLRGNCVGLKKSMFSSYNIPYSVSIYGKSVFKSIFTRAWRFWSLLWKRDCTTVSSYNMGHYEYYFNRIQDYVCGATI